MREKISRWQLGLLVASFILGTSNVLQIGLNYTGRDTWIAETISMIMGLIIISMIAYIVNKFSHCNTEQILESLFSKFIAKSIIVIYTLFAFLLGVLVLDNIGSFMKIMMMQDTPIWIFITSISLVTGYIMKLGLEICVRIIELIMPIIILILFFCYFTKKYYELSI